MRLDFFLFIFFICAKFIFKIIACAVNENIKKVVEKGERRCVREGEEEGQRCNPTLGSVLQSALLGESSFVPQISVLHNSNIISVMP